MPLCGGPSNKFPTKIKKQLLKSLELRKQGKYEAARDLCDPIWKANSDLPHIIVDSKAKTAFEFALKASAYYRLGDHKNSIAMYLQAIKLGANSAFIYSNLAYEYYDLKDYDNAQKYVTIATQKDPKYLDALELKGHIHGEIAYDLASENADKQILERECTEAVNAYNQALKLDPNAVLTRCNLADVLHLQGKDLEAAIHFRRAAELYRDPANHKGFNDGNHRFITELLSGPGAELIAKLGVIADAEMQDFEMPSEDEEVEDPLYFKVSTVLQHKVETLEAKRLTLVHKTVKAISDKDPNVVADNMAEVTSCAQECVVTEQATVQFTDMSKVRKELKTNPQIKEYLWGLEITFTATYHAAAGSIGGLALDVSTPLSKLCSIFTVVPIGGELVASLVREGMDGVQSELLSSSLGNFSQIASNSGEFNDIVLSLSTKIAYAKQEEIKQYRPEVKTWFEKIKASLGKLIKAQPDDRAFDTPYKMCGRADALKVISELYKTQEKSNLKLEPEETFVDRAASLVLGEDLSSILSMKHLGEVLDTALACSV